MITISSKLHDKWARPEEADKALTQAGIEYTSHNLGLHWKFAYEGVEYNYFPTTGRWYTVTPKHSCTNEQRFLSGLLTYLGITFKEI